MKKLIIPISMLFVAGLSHAQATNTENYIQTRVYLEPVTTSSSTAKQIQTVQYLDGLGRPKQVVSVKASPQGKDVVSHIEYDQYGRQVKDYLPVPQSGTMNGAIVPDPLANAIQPAIYGSEKIYAEKLLESSPLNRVFEQKQVGNAWNDKPVKFEYDANSVADAVKKYTTTTTSVNGATHSVLSQTVNYEANKLFKNTVIDEDGNKTIEFKNGEGQTLLVRKNDGGNNVDTYYVYNEFNQLAYVIPPLASVGAVNQTALDNLCYQYRYDGDSRLAEKKLPGKGWEYMVYDKQDRLVLTQDANLRTTTNNFAAKGWMFTKYDSFGRVVYTGFFSNTATRTAMQTAINNMTANPGNNEVRSETSFNLNGMDVFYTKNAFPTGSMKILSVNYYDSYPAYSFNPSFPSTIYGKTILTDNAATLGKSTKSLPVMTLVKNIEDDNWTKSYSYYDTKGRTVGSYAINHLGGYTKTESELDFAGTVLQTKTYHKRLANDTEKVITETFTYDHQNRLKVHKHKIDNNTEEILAQNEYNELSQLKTKKVGGKIVGNGLQTVDYQYNIKGWMTQINDPNNLGTDLFGYKIKYNQVEGLVIPDTSDTALQVKPRFNGNIAEIDWKTSTQENEPLKRYGYVYDNLNRLSAGFYQDETNPSLREYYEKATYDLNGNIMSMKRSAQRMGATALVIDELSYEYQNNNLSNRLKSITESNQTSLGYPYINIPSDIGYDENGNTTTFNDKGISSIQYNYLNLPKQITQNGQVTNYTYRADGVKMKKLYGTVETNYLDGFQYKYTQPGEDESGLTSVAAMKLRFLPTSEGYYDALLNLYVYNYVDHLGNVRISYADSDHNGSIKGRDERIKECYDGNCIDYFIPGEIVANNTYYPFGMLFDHIAQANSRNAFKMKYNGKELQETGMYDYGARFYMPDVIRWGTIDPLAEKMTRHSPYNYAFNNPIRFIDPDGRAPLTGSAAQQAFMNYRNSMPLTDFTFNKKTGEVRQVGETNDRPDRIVKINKKGEAKVEVDNIAKGILKNGQNFKENDQIIDVGGKNQATLEQAEDFVVALSDYVGVELAGAYLSKDASENGAISKVYLEKYKNNTNGSSVSSLYWCRIGAPMFDGYFQNTSFHTHPTIGYSRTDIENPSRQDLETKSNYRKEFYKFLILTREANSNKVQRIDYTNY
ncbi:RHS repeat-associated core domain-containing protein [Chryseobacterium aahli]|uniref:DUF6443 domain-containing protein n=1 Tax=Chryseobacterium aahli TaxID=1278643 RepID=UPI001F615285|nr:DUF6443 domain-containing protein [Chryseobacterium aahli]MCI3938908.1 RHS repeat-associated core domain-containing protein [Chryseobacterium aahli]